MPALSAPATGRQAAPAPNDRSPAHERDAADGAARQRFVDMELTVVYRFREDKVIAAEFFWDRDQAMAAAAAQGAARST